MFSRQVIHNIFVTEENFHNRALSCVSLAQAPHTSLSYYDSERSICFLGSIFPFSQLEGRTSLACTPQSSPKLSVWLSNPSSGGRGQRPSLGPSCGPTPFPVGHLEFSYHLTRIHCLTHHSSMGICAPLCTKRLGRTFLCRAKCLQGLF